MTRASIRRPAVAGLFYPREARAADTELARLITPVEPKAEARGIVVPHAGWTYSGRVAGAVYGRLRLPGLAIILGPNHTGLGPRGSVMPRGRWAVPGGEVEIAEEVARAVLDASRELEPDELAHLREHAIEVQLPFLRRLRPDLRFVPITLMRAEPDFCGEVGRAVAAAVRGAAEPVLLVCSTDLNHYEPQAVSTRKDRLAIEALLSLDPERLHATVTAHGISMCGLAPGMAVLAALQALGPGDAELVRYETSGDVSGDYSHVVGYAGLLLR